MNRFILPAIVVFQIITLALYYFGPIQYEWSGASPIVAIYVAFYLGMLILGYFLGRKYYLKGQSGPSNLLGFVKIAAVATLLFFPFALMAKVGDISSAMSVGDLYGLSGIKKSESEGAYDYIRMFLGYFLFGLFPVLVWHGKKLPRAIATLGWVAIFSNVLLTLLVGVNKIIFDYLMIAVTLVVFRSNVSDFLTKKGMALATAAVLLMALAAVFFVEGQLSRYGSSAISGEDPRLGAYSKYNADDGELKILYSAMTGYLSQGYRAFDLALSKPFEFTWGVGNSTFFSRQVDRVLGTDLGDSTYPAQIEMDGWDRYINWSTFYVWWASDLSFYGVALLMILIGIFFRVVENTLLIQEDLSAVILYSFMIVMLFYLSANNQIFQSGEMALGFLFLFFPFIMKRKLVRRGGDF